MLLSRNQRYRPIYGSLAFGFSKQDFVPYGKPIEPEYGPERLRLLDGFGDFTATKEQIERVGTLVAEGVDVRRIARTLKLREIDALLIALHIYTDKATGEVRW